MRLVSNWAKFPETVVQLTIYTREGVRSRDYLTVAEGEGGCWWSISLHLLSCFKAMTGC